MLKGASIRFRSIAGIPLRVHASWLIALFLATTSLSSDLAPSAGRFALVIALATALALFASLIAHELGHALVARRCGVGVKAITLFVFGGGVATLDTEPRRPRDEFAIAIAGPIVSVLIGAGTLANRSTTTSVPEPMSRPG
jgi:Zn-dependent protease